MFRQLNLKQIDVLVGERSDQIRNAIIAMLRQQGIGSCRGVHDLMSLKTAIQKKPSDFIVVSDDLDDKVFKLLRQIRMNKLGINPFTVITVMVDPNNKKSFQWSVNCGADDILTKPVAPATIVERAEYIAFERIPFTATKDYVGPYRKELKLDERVSVIQVLNTLRDKMEGKTYTLESLGIAVAGCMRQIRSVKLDSQSLRLEYICNLILKAYQRRDVGPDVEGYLTELIGSLKEAALIAGQLDQPDLATACQSFAVEIEEMAKDYHTPTKQNLDLVGKLTRVFKDARLRTAAAH